MAIIDTKQNNRLQESLKKTLSSPDADKAFKSFIDDFSTPNKKAFPVSIRTIFKGAKFVLSNPINTYNLIKLAGASDTYLNSEFQKTILEKPEIWDFLKKHSNDLPKVGQTLAKVGFKEFQEGNFLDQKGLNILKECFKSEEILKNLQEIAIEVRKEAPDWTKVTSKTLEMLSRDENFKKFFNEKGQEVANYLRLGATEILPSDYLKTFDDLLKKEIYSNVKKIFDNNPDFKQELAENINNPSAIAKFNKLSLEKQIYIEGFLAEVKEQAKPALKEYFESYKVDSKVLDIVPNMLNKIPEAKEIFDTLNKPDQGVMVALEKILKMVVKDDKLKNFFASNKEFLPNMASGIIKNNPDLQQMTKDYNLDTQMLKIVGEVMSKPEVAYNIIADVNKGDYMKLTSDLIVALNDPSFKLKDTVVGQSRKGLFDNLIEGILKQDEKGDQTIKKQLENYGLEAKDVTKINSIMSVLVDKSEILQKVFNGFIKGDYMGVTKELIKLTKDTHEIKQYLNDNKEIFAKVLDKNLAEIPGINKLDKKEIYNILPSMLNHPDELVNIIEGVENGNYKNAAYNIYNLAQKTNYFEGQLPNLAKAGIEVSLSYATQKVISMFSSLTATSQDKEVTTAPPPGIPASVLDEAKNITSNLNGSIKLVETSNSKFFAPSITPISNSKQKREIKR